MEIVPEKAGEVICSLTGDVVEVDAMPDNVHHWKTKKYTINSLAHGKLTICF